MSPTSEDRTKISILEERVENLQVAVDKQENQIERLKEQVSTLNQTTAEMKVYVGQIFTILEDIKASIKMLGTLGEKAKDNNHEMWISVFRQALFLVIGASLTFAGYYLLGHK